MAYGLPKKREEVVKTLEQAYLEGNLDETSYEQRLTLAYEAKTIEELKEILYDFPELLQIKIFSDKERPYSRNRTQTNKEAQDFRSNNAAPHAFPRAYERKVIFSEQSHPLAMLNNDPVRFSNMLGKLKMSLKNTRVQTDVCHIHLETWLGNTKINLLNPELAGKEVHLHVHGGVGEIYVRVPAGTQVSRPIQIILGEFSYKKRMNLMNIFKKEDPYAENEMAFHLIIHGSFLVGNVQVRY